MASESAVGFSTSTSATMGRLAGVGSIHNHPPLVGKAADTNNRGRKLATGAASNDSHHRANRNNRDRDSHNNDSHDRGSPSKDSQSNHNRSSPSRATHNNGNLSNDNHSRDSQRKDNHNSHNKDNLSRGTHNSRGRDSHNKDSHSRGNQATDSNASPSNRGRRTDRLSRTMHRNTSPRNGLHSKKRTTNLTTLSPVDSPSKCPV